MTTPIRHLMCAAWAVVAAPAAAAQESYLGMCDASGAVALGRGHFVVADDESDVLRIYKRGTAMPVGSVDLIDYLRNRKPSGKNAEADIEGAAAIEHRIYWVTSHALKGKEGEADPHRRRFFATDIVTGGEPPTPSRRWRARPTNRCSTICWPIRAFHCWPKPPGASPSKRAALTSKAWRPRLTAACSSGFATPCPRAVPWSYTCATPARSSTAARNRCSAI